jgi:hypothetical protein
VESTVLASLGFGVQSLLFNLFLLRLGHDEAFMGTVTSIPSFAAAATAPPSGSC